MAENNPNREQNEDDADDDSGNLVSAFKEFHDLFSKERPDKRNRESKNKNNQDMQPNRENDGQIRVERNPSRKGIDRCC